MIALPSLPKERRSVARQADNSACIFHPNLFMCVSPVIANNHRSQMRTSGRGRVRALNEWERRSRRRKRSDGGPMCQGQACSDMLVLTRSRRKHTQLRNCIFFPRVKKGRAWSYGSWQERYVSINQRHVMNLKKIMYPNKSEHNETHYRI